MVRPRPWSATSARSASSSSEVATEVTASAFSSAERTKPCRNGSNAYFPTSLPRIEAMTRVPCMRPTIPAMYAAG